MNRESGGRSTLYYLLGTFGLVVIMAGLTIIFFSVSGAGGTTQGITILEAPYPWTPSLHESATQADLIVEGVVKEAKEARWNTSDQQRPNLSVREIVRDPFLRIVTPYVLSVSGVVKGDLRESQIPFLQIGGRVDEDQVVVADSSRQLVVGEHVVLFLQRREASDISARAPNAWSILSKYVVTDRGQACGAGECIAISDLYQVIGAH